jgi:hypothetical protein
MGNDGGSIPDRRDLVRNKPKAEQADKANQTRAKWFFCALSKVGPDNRFALHPLTLPSCSVNWRNQSLLVGWENCTTETLYWSI